MRGLANILKEIVVADAAKEYDQRNRLIMIAMIYAMELGLSHGFRFDPGEPNWPVAFIWLPDCGQVSWHLPAFPVEWDGHTITQKNERIARFIENQHANV